MRLVVFDLDGTLIDSEKLIVDTVTRAFSAVGHKVPSEDDIRATSGITAREAMAILAPGATPERVDAILESYRTHYRAVAGVSREPLFRGALEALDRLAKADDTTLAVATGKGYRGATALLEAHGLADRFQSVQTPYHNAGKPNPQMLETAMSRAGVDRAPTVMIGDTVHDMRMAKSAGVSAIGVSWGYHLAVDLHSSGADMVIDSFEELDAAIERVLGARHA